jgi:hypothetical protein
LQALLDRQDDGQQRSEAEREEAMGLVELSERFTPIRVRSERLAASEPKH